MRLLVHWLLERWHARQRAIDLRILWPACCAQAPNIDRAREAFARHAFHDSAWTPLGPDEIYRTIDRLGAP